MPESAELHTPESKRRAKLTRAPGLGIRAGLLVGLSAGLLAGLLACDAPGQDPRPNVVLIVLDTTRADILSAYGYPKPTSPNLAKIAEEGVLFRQAMSTDFWTLPAHASLFTGQYPTRHQATSETNRLDDRVTTLAEYLNEAGYRTRAYVSNAWIGAERGFGQGFETYVETWQSAPGDYESDRAAIAGARDWVEARAKKDEPFFLFLNLNSAHMPYSPDVSTLVELSPQPMPIERTRKLRRIKGMWAHLGGEYALEDLDFEILENLYAAEVAMVDQLVGKLIRTLETSEVLDETLLIVTADHGENLGEHGMVDHLLSMYDTTIRIPLILRHPGTFPAGEERDELVSLVDLVPTVLEICGLKRDADEFAGRSLASAEPPGHEFVVAENGRPINGIDLMRKSFPDFDTQSIDHRMKMLRTRQHKLIWYDDDRIELYDLAADPGETHDLAEENPELARELLQKLEDWADTQGTPIQTKPLEITDPATQERLRALGYIE
ncbi:MAG: sulfatase [Myxococcota bacterium]|nr:sulfatase [Myxococcota bacterium]